MTDEPMAAKTSIVALLLPIMMAVSVAFLIIGMAMPVLPLYVHQVLGFGTFIVGLVAGSQFAASLISRFWSGNFADTRGPKRATVIGLIMASVSGLLYIFSLHFVHAQETSIMILILGRTLLGGAESCIMTGVLSWGMVLVGPQNPGLALSWVGTALLAAYAAGAPIGTALYAGHGFIAIALATILLPLVALLVVAPLRSTATVPKARPPVNKVISKVSIPGFGLAFSSVGYGATTTFVALIFAEHHWESAWLAFTVLSIAFILGRMLFGHMPDRIGGARVAFACILIVAAGQALIWLARTTMLIFLGAAATGLGHSLVYPALGVEAVHSVPLQSRGLALGAYSAFYDLALGLANPALGLIANRAGLGAVFLTSTVVVLCSAGIVMRLLYTPPHI